MINIVTVLCWVPSPVPAWLLHPAVLSPSLKSHRAPSGKSYPGSQITGDWRHMSLHGEHQTMSLIHHSLLASSHPSHPCGNPARSIPRSREATIGWDVGAGSKDAVLSTAACWAVSLSTERFLNTYQSRHGNMQQTSERPSRKAGCPGKEQRYLLAWDDKNENISTSEQTGEKNSASDEGSVGSLGVSGVACCSLFQPPPHPWKASPSWQRAVLSPCAGPRETQVSGKEWVGSCIPYPAGVNSSPRLPSHELGELGRWGGNVDFMPAQAHRIATHRLAAPRKLSGP